MSSEIYAEFEERLTDWFNLPEAIAVECSEDSDGAIMFRVGEAAAHYLGVTLQYEEVFRVSIWSENILELVDDVSPVRSGKTGYVVRILG